GGVPGRVSLRQSVANAKMLHDRNRMRIGARDPGDRNVQVTANKTCKQREKSQMRRQSQRLKHVVDYSNPDERKKESECNEEYQSIQDEKWSEDHGANGNSGLEAKVLVLPRLTTQFLRHELLCFRSAHSILHGARTKPT